MVSVPQKHLFQSYAHRDFTLVQRLMDDVHSHLRACHTLSVAVWSDELIPIGSDWDAEITSALKKADAGFLLLSPAALGSTYIRKTEIPALLPDSRLLLIGLRPVDFQTQLPPALARLQVFRLKTAGGHQRFYSECTPQQRGAFVFELYRQIERRLA